MAEPVHITKTVVPKPTLTTVSEKDLCHGCLLRDKYPDSVFVGPIAGSIYNTRLAVGEAPGKKESEEGIPFVGGSGNILNALYGKAGIDRSKLAVANTLCCRPPQNVYPTAPQARTYCSISEGKGIVDHCYKAYLGPFLKSKEWSRIDALGEHALRAVTGESGISRWRGSILKEKQSGREVVVPTFHPAFVMRDWSSASIVVSDLKKSTIRPPQDYTLWPSLEQVKAFKAETLYIDIETNRFTQEITLVGVGDRPYRAYTIPFKGPYKAEIRRLLVDAKTIVTQNGVQFDIPILCKNLDLEW